MAGIRERVLDVYAAVHMPMTEQALADTLQSVPVKHLPLQGHFPYNPSSQFAGVAQGTIGFASKKIPAQSNWIAPELKCYMDGTLLTYLYGYSKM